MNNAGSSSTYDAVLFELKYPSIDHIVDANGQSDTEVLLSKTDVSRAFRNLCVDPRDYNLLGMQRNGSSYLDISVPMGLKTGSALCQHTTDILCYILKSKDVNIYNYIDDVICMHKACHADAEFDMMHSLFEFLGIPIDPKKVVWPGGPQPL